MSLKSFKIKGLEEKWKLEPLRTKGLHEQTALSSLTLQDSLIALTRACLQAEGTYAFDHRCSLSGYTREGHLNVRMGIGSWLLLRPL